MLLKAVEFATLAHHGQLRKYTDEPYILHPISVAGIVSTVSTDESMLSAAILHDTVEDTLVTIEQIEAEFGSKVALYVDDLTDASKPSDGNRKKRKLIDLEHTAKAHPNSKTIKLADLIHNSISIVKLDPHFAVVYMREKQKLMEVLSEGNKELFDMANGIIMDYYLEQLNARHRSCP